MDDAIQELIYAAYGAEARLQRPGCCVRYWLRGDETTKPVVMFLHGAGVDHRMWASQIDAFAPQYRVLTLDLRGHGQSRPAGHYSFDAVVEDCFALLDRLNVERAFVIGLSMGGNVAQEMAFKRPERIAAMICLDCTCNTLAPWADRTLVPLYRAVFGPMMALYPTNALLDQIGRGSSLRAGGQRYLREASAQLSKTELTTVMKSLLATLHHEPNYKATIPELLMHGSDDRLGNIRKIMPIWHRRDLNSEFVVIPNASHCANVDNPQAFNRTALEWLDRVARTPVPETRGA